VRLREALGRRGLVALLALLTSCATGPQAAPPVSLESARTPEELRALLDSICSRTDFEAMLGRARVYARLQELERSNSPTLLALGDAADLDVLSHASTEAAKMEAAARLSTHFVRRAEEPILSRSSFPGELGESLRRVVLLSIATFYGEIGSRRSEIAAQEKLASVYRELARQPSLSPDSVLQLQKRAEAARARVSELASSEGNLAPSPDTLKFCDADLSRHLEEGTRAADLGTREKADRANLDDVLHWYLMALAHYGVVRETVAELTPAQEHVLAAQEIVVRSLCDLLCREP
jgi:hypothetical protein